MKYHLQICISPLILDLHASLRGVSTVSFLKGNKNLQGDTTFDGPFKSAQSSHSGYLNFFILLFPILSNLNQNEKNSISLTKLRMKNAIKTIILKNGKAHDNCAHCKKKSTFLSVQLGL